jgi:hypothetical protein
MPRGGRRPGAGAPKGNLNALKHGERSKQFAGLGAIVARSPKAATLLLRYARRAEAEDRKADELAQNVLMNIISRGLVRGEDRLILLPELLKKSEQSNKIRQTAPFPNVRTQLAPKIPPQTISPYTPVGTPNQKSPMEKPMIECEKSAEP